MRIVKAPPTATFKSFVGINQKFIDELEKKEIALAERRRSQKRYLEKWKSDILTFNSHY